MNQAKGYQGWYVGVLVAWGLLGAIAAPCATAQITPDSTLGNEGSRVTRNVTIRGGNADRIDGGAPRGSNLFHSFSNFNVNAGQRVYFANPAGVQNILTRVTGNTASDIMGTLGVDGSANLFLLNPNGIIFGPNAQLDVGGSFTASTANSFTFPGGSEFSATTPGDGSLLSVAVPMGVQYGAIPPGAIANAGNLSVGQNLSLSGGSVTSSGQLAAPAGQLLVEGVAGDVQVRQAIAQTATLSASNNLILQESQLQTAGDLNLLAGNTVQVRDSVTNSFVAYAGGNLTVQGNQGIDIFALNHPSSGLVSGGDMVLRSANSVGGDAHYWTGGSFRIEQLDGDPGNLFSPYDPIIRSSGDVVFGDYTGASLHIFAGGSVTAGNITITGGDPNGIQETVTLSDPIDPLRPVDQVTIDGTNPTLDIRAGTTAFGTPSLTPNPIPGITNLNTPTSSGTRADIVINSIRVPSAGNAQVFLTNQYTPNSLDPLTGLVKVASPIESFASSVIIDSRGDITLNGVSASSGVNAAGSILLLSGGNIHAGGFYSTGSTVTNGGPITFNAAGNIITTDTLVSDVSGNNRNRRSAGSINFFSNGFISADSIIASNNIDVVGGGDGGNIILNALYNITTGNGTFTGGGGISVTAGLASFARNGNSGNITLISREGTIDTTRGEIRSSTGAGNGGNVELRASNSAISTNTIRSFVGDFDPARNFSTGGFGNAGNITLNASGAITVNGSIDSFTGIGQGGKIDLTAGLSISSTDRITSFATGGAGGEVGSGGNITLAANNGNLEIGNVLSLVGSFLLPGRDAINDSLTGGNGDAGDITLRAERGTISTDRIVSFVGTGDAGNVILNAKDTINIFSIRSFAGSYLGNNQTQPGNGNAGDITITSATGNITLDPQGSRDILAFSSNSNPSQFSEIALTANQGSVILDRARLNTTNTGNGLAGDIRISANAIEITNGSEIESQGSSGRISINSLNSNSVVIRNSILNTETVASSNGRIPNARGEINIQAGRIDINRSQLTTSTNSNGANAGRIRLNANAGDVSISNSTLSSTTNIGSGDPNDLNTPNIFIQGDSINVRNRSQITTSTNSDRANAGSIRLNANPNTGNISIRNGSEVGSNTGLSAGLRGLLNIPNVTFRGDSIDITGNSTVTSDTSGRTRGGDITIETSRLHLNNSQVSASTTIATGQAGTLEVNADDSIEINGKGSRLAVQATRGGGRAGDLTINTDQLTLQNGSTATVESRRGRAGNLTVNSRQVTIENGASISASNDSFRPNTNAKFKFGNVRLRGLDTLLVNNGTITASTRIGRAGSVEINANDSVEISGENSRLAVEATGRSGRAGSLIINTDQLLLQDGASATVDSPNGQAGNIEIRANRATLDNGTLSANAGAAGTNNANINLTVSGTLLRLQRTRSPRSSQQDNPLISANATGATDGGNITINVENGFILTEAGINTDVTANASSDGISPSGDGGRVTINTNAIFGLERRDEATILSDITATSESGNAGTIALNTLNVDPTRGLGELPIDIVNTADLVADGCVGRNRSGVTSQGEFTSTGRGGLSSNPGDALTNGTTIDRLVTLDSNETLSNSASIPAASSTESLIVEAQGLALTDQGKVSLVSNSFAETPSPSVEQPATCTTP